MMAGMKKNFAHCVQQGSVCYPEWAMERKGEEINGRKMKGK
jgi:hypothetical protein